MSATLDYYNQNARSYTSATQALDFRSIQEHFLSENIRLKKGVHGFPVQLGTEWQDHKRVLYH